MATMEVTIPDIGDFDEVAVIELLVKVGDKVRAEQSLITVESDKASMEIPSSHAGEIKAMSVKLGDKVKKGSVILTLETASAAGLAVTPLPVVAAPPVIASAAKQSETAAPSGLAVTEAKQTPVISTTVVIATAAPSGLAVTESVMASAAKPSTDTALPHASPSVRKFARELGVPLNEVKGSGPKGRISQEDVQSFSRAVMTGETRTQAQSAKAPAGDGGAGLGLIPWPKVDFAKFGPIERKELGRIQKISGANLLRNAVMIPAVTNHDDADITELEAFRVATNKENEKVGSRSPCWLSSSKLACLPCKSSPSSTARSTAMHWFTNSIGILVLRLTRPMV
jgi:pyruvate dehydrogenase E2 component (dihydrolipoamide acetyltransferase)